MGAVDKHGTVESLHEAIAVIREEYLELENAVFFGNKNNLTVNDVKKEAIQLAAMATELAVLIDNNVEKFRQL
jgi:hypothetical protein